MYDHVWCVGKNFEETIIACVTVLIFIFLATSEEGHEILRLELDDLVEWMTRNA